jgi:hypothetical protein|tara:strand:+ start:358 stop:501 length:144 start_codon:yes stop_codon:yes gene_type:complete
MTLEELLTELLELADKHGGSATTNILNVVCNPTEGTTTSEVIIKTKA